MFGTDFGVTTAKRLKTIEVRAGAALVRAYALAYTESPSTGRSLLASVTAVRDRCPHRRRGRDHGGQHPAADAPGLAGG